MLAILIFFTLILGLISLAVFKKRRKGGANHALHYFDDITRAIIPYHNVVVSRPTYQVKKISSEVICSNTNPNSFSNHHDRLTIITGPMFAGKTSLMTSRLETFYDLNLAVKIFNHEKDDRITANEEKGIMTSHRLKYTQPTYAEKVHQLMGADLTTIKKDGTICQAEIVGIDEGHFFPDLYQAVRELILNNTIVFVVTLSGSSNLNTIGQAHLLAPLVNQTINLSAYCDNCRLENPGCLVPAYYSAKIVSETDTDEVCVGGKDKFIAVCLPCHKKVNI